MEQIEANNGQREGSCGWWAASRGQRVGASGSAAGVGSPRRRPRTEAQGGRGPVPLEVGERVRPVKGSEDCLRAGKGWGSSRGPPASRRDLSARREWVVDLGRLPRA